MSSTLHHSSSNQSLPSHTERPERSRNAKAQARHRAKRKAYIEQLEQTVTKLQIALGFSPDQVATLPPPLIKIRELEQENMRLHKENEEMRRMVSDPSYKTNLASDYVRRTPLPAYHDIRDCDRDYRKRKLVTDDVYMSPSATPPHTHDPLARPPPLTIPQPVSHHYGHVSSHASSNHNGSAASLYNLNAPTFQMPNTPSGSSSTSSPPFSQPEQMQSNSPVNQRPSLSAHPSLSNYPHQANNYGSVKVEDENFSQSNHSSHNGHYSISLPPFAHTIPNNDMDGWHGYSAERVHMHR